MNKNTQATIALTISIVIMAGCGGISLGYDANELLPLQYELNHMVVPTRIDRGDSIVGVNFYNPNDIAVNVDRITLTRLGTAGNEVIEVSMLGLDQNVHNALQTREGDRHTFEIESLEIPPGEHLVQFRVFVSEPCQTIGYTIQSDADIIASGQDGEEIQVYQGPNSVFPEPIQVFGNNISFSLASNTPQSQDVQQGEGNVVAMVFNVNAQMWVEGMYAFVFMDHLPWEVAQHVVDIELSVLVDGEWESSLGPQDLNPEGCEPSELDCYVNFTDAYSITEADVCTNKQMRIEYTLSDAIPFSTEIQFYVHPQAWGFYDVENDQVLTSENTSGDTLHSSVFTVVP